MITILTWFWKQPDGRADYRPEHVNIWADMVSRNLTIPHRIACVTRHRDGIDGHIDIIDPPGDFEDVFVPAWDKTLPQCYRRIAMFRPDAAEIFGERFACMDLDCVVTRNLDSLFKRSEDFVMLRSTNKTRPYNGSLLMMDAGARPDVYRRFSPRGAAYAGTQFIGSDQAWISAVLGPGEATWGREDGIHAYGRRNTPEARVTFFMGDVKPWDPKPQSEDWVLVNYRKLG